MVGYPRVLLGYIGWTSMKMGAIGDFIKLMSSGAIDGVHYTVGSLLPMARNHLIQAIYRIENEKQKTMGDSYIPWTHLLMYDTDMYGIETSFIVDCVKKDCDVAAPIMTQRAVPFNICNYGFDEKHIPLGTLVECDRVGTGCILIHKRVLDYIAEETPGGTIWFNTDRQPRKTLQTEVEAKIAQLYMDKATEFTCQSNEDIIKTIIEGSVCEGVKLGLNAHRGSEYLGEDIGFCEVTKRSGFKIWTHCGVRLRHIGECAYGIQDRVELLARAKRGDFQQYTESIQLESVN